MEISDYRKKELANLAEFISTDYCSQGQVLPELIAKRSGITYNYGEYGDYFDGLLEHDSGEFHIYLNTQAVLSLDNARLRFSFAHELGHYFIDNHRNALKKGKSLHKSYYRFLRKNVVETEADYFASNLLMPLDRFRKRAQQVKKFDFSLIEFLSKEFGTSLSATLLRFIEVNTHPIMVVFSKNNVIERCWRSNDFPFKYFLEHSSKRLPPLTVAGDYFNHGIKCEDTESVDACEWFSTYEDIRGLKLFEKCIYPTFNSTVISVLWSK
jgi:Zn-dependent peptidase ImmA (M78 family)